MPTTPLRGRPSWKALEQHHAGSGARHLRELFPAGIVPELTSATEPELGHDSSTNALIRRYRELKARR